METKSPAQIKKSPMGRTDPNQLVGKSVQPSIFGSAAREHEGVKLFTLNDAKLQVFTEGSRIYWLPVRHIMTPRTLTYRRSRKDTYLQAAGL
jgi:aminoglycoside phosphotransferase